RAETGPDAARGLVAHGQRHAPIPAPSEEQDSTTGTVITSPRDKVHRWTLDLGDPAPMRRHWVPPSRTRTWRHDALSQIGGGAPEHHRRCRLESRRGYF